MEHVSTIAVPPSDSPTLGFWAGYRLWLSAHRRTLVALIVLSLVLFLFGLWFGSSPQDPFQYELF